MSATPSPWRRVEPPGGRPYYYNKATRAVLWSLPPDVAAEEVKTVHQRKVPAVEAGFGVPGGPSPAAAAKCTLAALLQELEGDCTPTARAWGTGMPRRTIAPMAAAGEVWEARHAASQGLEEGEIYYVNRVTGESVWERPPGFGEAEGPLAALERAFPSSWTVCECVCRVGLDRVRPLASALHGDSATDVTPLFTALTTLAFLLQHRGTVSEWTEVVSMRNAALPRWILQCWTPLSPISLCESVAALLTSMCAFDSSLSFRLVNASWRPLDWLLTAVVQGVHASSTGGREWECSGDVLTVVRLPASGAVGSVFSLAAFCTRTMPPAVEGAGEEGTGESGTRIWCNLLSLLAAAMQACVEPEEEGLTHPALTPHATDTLAQCLLQGEEAAVGDAFKLLSQLSGMQPPDVDPVPLSCWRLPNLPDLAQALISEINACGTTGGDSGVTLCVSLCEFTARLLLCVPESHLFYTNDMNVLIDIILQQLVDLPLSDKRRGAFVHLLRVLLLRSQWAEKGSFRRADILSVMETMLAAGNTPGSDMDSGAKVAVERLLDQCCAFLEG